mmetsp:Transcript_46447/g.92727  ORF Transcript_46447/g.92727 Transcript_46447/m.92727 type:complete len:123 (-) Transcript_46447:251-619(-)
MQRRAANQLMANGHAGKRDKARATPAAARRSPSSVPMYPQPAPAPSSAGDWELPHFRLQLSLPAALPPKHHNKRRHTKKNGKSHKPHTAATHGSRVAPGQSGAQRGKRSIYSASAPNAPIIL